MDTRPEPLGAGQVRDDRVLLPGRVLAVVVIPVLLGAVVVLFLMPDKTNRFFPWAIKPHMSEFLLASTYAGGMYYFVRLLLDGRWHRVAAGLPAILAFVTVEGIATILHWDKFNHGNPTFSGWVFLYFVTPFLLPLIWARNRATDPGDPEKDDVVLPRAARVGFACAAVVQSGLCLYLLLFPKSAIGVWGWKLTPLTARVSAGWFALGIGGLFIALETRWSAARILVESLLVALTLLAIGIVRAWNELDTGRAATWLFVCGVGGALVGLSVLHTTMQRSQRAQRAASTSPP